MKSQTGRNIFLVAVSAVVFIAIIYASFQSKNASYRNLSVQEVKQRIDSKKNDFVLIDVRTPQEYSGQLGHLANAPLFPLQSLDTQYKDLEKYQQEDKDIIVYCRSGNRSRRAAEFLINHGFKNIYNMEGGMRAWNADYGRPAGSDNSPPNLQPN